jgi:hypothetical protein
MGGDLTVQSVYGEVAIFTSLLPAVVTEAGGRPAEHAADV